VRRPGTGNASGREGHLNQKGANVWWGCSGGGVAVSRLSLMQHTHGHGAGLGEPVLHGVLECLSSGYRRWRHPTLWRLCVTPVPCLHTPSRCPSPTSVR
jgi:hypothetical protein